MSCLWEAETGSPSIGGWRCRWDSRTERCSRARCHGEMPAIYSVADIVVQPSQLFEPFGLVVRRGDGLR